VELQQAGNKHGLALHRNDTVALCVCLKRGVIQESGCLKIAEQSWLAVSKWFGLFPAIWESHW
jgi:hypothetical protein